METRTRGVPYDERKWKEHRNSWDIKGTGYSCVALGTFVLNELKRGPGVWEANKSVKVEDIKEKAATRHSLVANRRVTTRFKFWTSEVMAALAAMKVVGITKEKNTRNYPWIDFHEIWNFFSVMERFGGRRWRCRQVSNYSVTMGKQFNYEGGPIIFILHIRKWSRKMLSHLPTAVQLIAAKIHIQIQAICLSRLWSKHLYPYFQVDVCWGQLLLFNENTTLGDGSEIYQHNIFRFRYINPAILCLELREQQQDLFCI